MNKKTSKKKSCKPPRYNLQELIKELERTWPKRDSMQISFLQALYTFCMEVEELKKQIALNNRISSFNKPKEWEKMTVKDRLNYSLNDLSNQEGVKSLMRGLADK